MVSVLDPRHYHLHTHSSADHATMLQAAQIRKMHRFSSRTAGQEPKRTKDAWSEVLTEAAWMANAFRRYSPCC